MTPSIHSAICKECGEWHDMFKELRDGTFVCINCFYKNEEEEEVEDVLRD